MACPFPSVLRILREGGYLVRLFSMFWYGRDSTLGIELDYPKKWQVHISMASYLNKLIWYLPDEITSVSVTPVAENLFKVRGKYDKKKLPE